MWAVADMIAAYPTKEEMLHALRERHGAVQEAFDHAAVAVCGLGGLGSNIAIALARAGVGRLRLIDFDRVDLTNLNRQQYMVSQLGMYKTEALKDTLRQIAPYCQIETHTVRITAQNACELLKDVQIVCEAFDGAEQKAMLVNCVLEGLPDAVIISGSGMAGFHSANRIRTRKVSRRFYLCGDETSDVSQGMGLVSARVMVCAAHQAHMALRILAGEDEA